MVVKQVCTFAIGVLLARLLGPHPFGIIAVAMLLSGLAGLIADFGFSAALVQRKTVTEHDVRFAFTAQLALAVVLAGATFTAAPLFAAIFHQPAAVSVIRVLSAVFIIQAVGQVSAALLKRNLRFRDLQAAQVGSYLVAYVGIGIPLAAGGYGVWSLVAAQIAQTGLRSAWLYSQERHPLGFACRPSDSGLGVFGAKVIATNIANWSISNLDNAFVGRFFTAVDLGFYTRIFVLVMTPVDAMVTTMQQVLFPAYCRARSRDEAATRTYLASVSAVLLLVAPAALVVAVIPQTVVSGLLGAEWVLAVPLLVPLALAAPFHAAMGMAGPLLWGQDAVGRELRMQVRVAALAGGVLLVASRYSVPVMAWAVAGIYVVRCVLVTGALVSRQRLPVWSLARIAGRPFMLAATIAAAVFLLDQLLSDQGMAAPVRLLTNATTGVGAWILLLLCMPSAFITPSLRVSLSRVERHFPTRLRPFLQQLTAGA